MFAVVRVRVRYEPRDVEIGLDDEAALEVHRRLEVARERVGTGARRARAVYATAALFALLHPVWPNPVPLFVLGLGLGWLAARTTGLLVPVLVHALFNAVSAVFVLRGG